MTFWIGFALYSAVMAFVWGFFLVARMHVFKFREYSVHVEPATRFLALFLLVLTAVGYVAIYNLDSPKKTETVAEQATKEEY
ncbi:MAG: hypothetical protein QG650_2 [Patescibacteria group bacterium]|nr:hypothetical protein [Patescibacteria group bacterium]